MKVQHDVSIVHTTHPFVIARGGASEHRLIRVRVIDDDGTEGWGEASPNRFYGETVDTALGALARLTPIVERCDPWALEDVELEMNRALRLNGSVKSAISAALHDLAAKRLGVPLYKMWGLDPAKSPLSSFTIGIAASDDELRERVGQAAEYPVLKVKLGTDHDAQIIRTCARTRHLQRCCVVDANAAWTPKQALVMINVLVECGWSTWSSRWRHTTSTDCASFASAQLLPVIADESCVVSTDIARLVGCVDGINIKLSKCGGLREALRMIATARSHGMLVMCGCMIETSLGITAAAHFAPLLDYADFDGAALLSDDPYVGATIVGGRIAIPTAPGLGVRKR
jgi:L-alanine-DL-glutamate epimerase-like enolase superfamily enzyme